MAGPDQELGPSVESADGWVLSEMTAEDHGEAIALWRETEGIGLSSADSAERIRAYLERNPGLSFVARQGGVLVGAILSGHDGRRGFIHHVAVAPNHQRRGLGRALVDRSLTALARTGIDKCHLFVLRQNRSGHAFWEGTGWTARGELTTFSRFLDAEPR